MKIKISYCLIIISTVFISCNKNSKDALAILNSFYLNKSKLIQAHYQKDTALIKKYEDLTTESWNNIIQNREAVLSLLINMENNTSYSIYGNDYIDNNFSKEKIPDNLHSLYLIECIIRNDYLFNRRKYTNFSYLEYFKSDCLNFIYDTTSPPELSYYEYSTSYDFSKNNTQLEAAWEIYKNWYYKDYIINKKLGKSPLDLTKYRWYSRIHMNDGKAVYSDINELELRCSKVKTNLGERYHLEFKIGDGWKDSR